MLRAALVVGLLCGTSACFYVELGAGLHAGFGEGGVESAVVYSVSGGVHVELEEARLAIGGGGNLAERDGVDHYGAGLVLRGDANLARPRPGQYWRGTGALSLGGGGVSSAEWDGLEGHGAAGFAGLTWALLLPHPPRDFWFDATLDLAVSAGLGLLWTSSDPTGTTIFTGPELRVTLGTNSWAWPP